MIRERLGALGDALLHQGEYTYRGTDWVARLDRADRLRTDAEAFAAATQDPRATCLAMDGIDPVPGERGGLIWEPLDPADERALLLLGIDDAGAPRFVRAPAPGARIDARSRTVMRLIPLLSPEEAALYGGARSLVDWHARHGFCAVCAAPTAIFRGGWGRKCGNCGSEHFPRVDPVVIMLVTDGDRCLMGRQSQFPPTMWSCLAGFVEAAETIEQAVQREILEEAGIHCTDVRYYMTQPWPYPSSLMIGCTAHAINEDIVIDRTELEDARWFDRAEATLMIKRQHPEGLAGPHPFAIAHHLLGRWVQDGEAAGT